jgi:hypothetical protein
MQPSSCDSAQTGQPVRGARWHFTLRQLFWWMFLASLLLAAAYYVRLIVNDVREAVLHSRRVNDFKQLMLGLHKFNDVNHRLPFPVVRSPGYPSRHVRESDFDGPPLSSWRFAIVPYLESNHIPFDFTQPWDAAGNAAWRRRPHRVYCFDSAGMSTHIMAVTGPDTGWGDSTTAPSSITELPHDLILVVEVSNSGTHWMQPGDIALADLPAVHAARGEQLHLGNGPRDGFFVSLADGSVRFIPRDLPFDQIAPYFTITGATAGDLGELLEQP